MTFLRKASIKRKQVLIIMLTTSLALLLACATLAGYEVLSFRAEMLRDLTTMAEMIGDNCAASIDFNDSKSAEETLAALVAQPHIVGACIYSKDGKIFAQYDRPNDARTMQFPKFQRNGHFFGKQDLFLFDPIDYKGDVVGVVYIASDMEALSAKLRQYAVIYGVVFAVALLGAFFLSARLQRIITDPVRELLSTTHAVAHERNYSLRAVKRTDDELGALTDGFNEMLAQIQERDTALQQAHNELEHRVADRTRELAKSEEELRGKTAFLEAQSNSTLDGILVVNKQAKMVFCNHRFGDIWKIPRHVLDKQDDTIILPIAVSRTKYPDPFLERVEYLYANPGEIGRDEVELKDGRFLDRYSAPVLGHDGTHYGRIWVFRDVTDRKRAEAELESAHRQLVDTSRQAGMAEVATSVLHNVGNVLNSVNISSSVVSEKIRNSKVVNLAKAVELIDGAKHDVGRFFAEDPRGRQLPAYLSNLALHLVEEREEILEELASLASNIEHIKEIVSMQQSYARVSGVLDEHKVVDLVEDALRINAGAMDRHEVTVVRDYQQSPVALVDKHKLMQILINIMRNAKYALDEGKPDIKQMTLRVTATANQRVQISVIDNGVGIPPENLTRIFGHGFTTRKEGHGFGLHSGALAAREMSGALTVHSDGAGKGATFMIEFPLKPQTEPTL